MQTIRDYMSAYGTSDGTKKAWDTRGRGRKLLSHARTVRKFIRDPAIIRHGRDTVALTNIAQHLQAGQLEDAAKKLMKGPDAGSYAYLILRKDQLKSLANALDAINPKLAGRFRGAMNDEHWSRGGTAKNSVFPEHSEMFGNPRANYKMDSLGRSNLKNAWPSLH